MDATALLRDPQWMQKKYIDEQIDANAIGRMIGRDGKTVWTWLRKHGIETRKRGYAATKTHFKPGQLSMFAGHRHTEETRKRLSEISIATGRVPYDPAVGSYMKGRRGAQTPMWKGGITPERQGFYASQEWKDVVPLVWKRDDASCQCCGKRSKGKVRYTFDIHHIVSFQCRELRAVLGNLVLLCEPCHYWVHSNDNTEQLFLASKFNAT